MRIVLIGPQGSGKGTQAQRLSALLSIPVIGMGEIIRNEIRKGTDLGAEFEKYINKGNLVPNVLTNDLAKKRLMQPDCDKGYILDGYPRHIEQATALDEYAKPDVVVLIEIPDDVSVKRLSSRLQCRAEGHVYGLVKQPKVQGVCDIDGSELYIRDDDKPAAIRQRLKVYHEVTGPVIEHYEKIGLVRRIDGARSPEEVFASIRNILQK